MLFFCYFNLPFPPPSPSSVTLIFQAKIFRAKKGEKLALSGHKINQILLPSLSTRPRRSVSSLLLLLLLSLCPSSISLPTLRQTAVGGEEERGEGGISSTLFQHIGASFFSPPPLAITLAGRISTRYGRGARAKSETAE